MGVDNMVMMVKITATPSVLEKMRNSYVLIAHSCAIFPCYLSMEIYGNQCKDPINNNKDCRVEQFTNVLKAGITKMMTIVMMKNKLMMWRTDSGIVHPSSSSPLGHWAIMSHLTKKC